MGLRVETTASDDLSVVILPSKTALRTTERTQAGHRQTHETPPATFRVRWHNGFVNIVRAWTHRPRLPSYEPVSDFRPRGIVCRMVPHFGEAVGEGPAVR